MKRTALLSLCLLSCGDSEPEPAASGGGCEAVAANWAKTCGEDEDFQREVCEDDEGQWLSAGCDEQWAAFTSCEASAKLDCEEGDLPTCESKLDALFVCQSQFVRRTGCTGLGYGDECGKDAPYEVYCLRGEPPSKACVEQEQSGSFCCP